MSAASESRWLLRGLGRGFWIASVMLALLALAFCWPAEKVGNGYQLLGLLIAALGVPVVSPWLARVEARAAVTKDVALKWIAGRWRSLKHQVARVFRYSRDATVHAKPARATGGLFAPRVTGGRVRDDYAGMDAEQLARRALDEVGWLRESVRALEEGRTADRVTSERRVESLRTDLERHVVSVTREGWHYILGGAGVTAVGIVIGLAA